MKLLIYLPAFNEEKRIGKTIKSLPVKIERVDEIEILVIDDGSVDNTAAEAKKYGATVVSFGTNKGVGAAFQMGVEKSLQMGADIMVSIDADGQFSPDDIPELIGPILDNSADFVTGNRFHEQALRPEYMPQIKYWGNRQIARLVSQVAGKKIVDVACGFRAYSREALLNLNLMGKFTYTQESIIELIYKGFRLSEVPIEVEYFSDRTSRVANSIIKYAYNTLFIIIRSVRDYQPLKFFGGIGVLLFSIGLVLDFFFVGHYAVVGKFTPYKSLGFVGGFLNVLGLLFAFIGIVTDMLYRQRVTEDKILYFLKKKEYEKAEQ